MGFETQLCLGFIYEGGHHMTRVDVLPSCGADFCHAEYMLKRDATSRGANKTKLESERREGGLAGTCQDDEIKQLA